jgi:hypothetical protein
MHVRRERWELRMSSLKFRSSTPIDGIALSIASLAATMLIDVAVAVRTRR